ncbi:hypothetical protein JNUCC1_03205 [Lentibacillus sp. JNUCC-1]|nr:hypothetical protein [Lentibacillus sp. JNUCC-1]
MRHYSILKLMLAALFLYFAWPVIPEAVTHLEKMFWLSWLAFFFLVAGANLATLLGMTRPPIIEQRSEPERRMLND